MNIPNTTSTTPFGECTIKLHSRFFPHSVREREKVIKILETQYPKQDGITRFIIVGSDFSTNIHVVDSSQCDWNDTLLEPWIDWIISNTSKHTQLILPVADCAAIAAVHKSWELNWVFHAWTKWIAWNGDLGIIHNALEKLKSLWNTDNLDEFKFYISPMMGSYFELNREYASKLFETIFSHYPLEFSDYSKDHREDKSKI